MPEGQASQPPIAAGIERKGGNRRGLFPPTKSLRGARGEFSFLGIAREGIEHSGEQYSHAERCVREVGGVAKDAAVEWKVRYHCWFRGG